MSGGEVHVVIRPPVALVSVDSRCAEVALALETLEAQGQPVLLVCLDRARHHHAPGADVMHVPLLSLGVLASFFFRIARSPAAVARPYLLLLLRAMTTPRVVASALLRLPAAVHLARVLPSRGVSAVQAADTRSEKLAGVVRELSHLSPPDLSDLPVDWARLGAQAIGVRWLSRRINSIAAEVSLHRAGAVSAPQRVVVKRQREHSGGSASSRFAHEYQTLASLRAAMGDGPYTVPRVLLSSEPAAMLVMERAPGTALDSLFSGTADPAVMTQLVAGVRGAGAWLAAMQAATRRGDDGPRLLGELLIVAAQDAAKLSATDAVLRRHSTRISRRLEVLASRVSSGSLTVAGHHDDYWPGNIFFDGERVTVIDFESFRQGFALEDAAFFLIRCDLLRRRFRVRFPDLEAKFFEGYCPGGQPDVEALQFFTITKGLRALARGMGEDLPLPQRVWTRSTIRNALLRAAGE